MMQRHIYKCLNIILSITLVATLFPTYSGNSYIGVAHAYAHSSVQNTASILNKQLFDQTNSLSGDTLPLLDEFNSLLSDNKSSNILLNVAINSNEEQVDQSQIFTSTTTPFVLSHIQSTYAATDTISNTLIVTFTLTNNLPPIELPQLNPAATLTENISLVSAFDVHQDPNTIRNVILTDKFFPQYATFLKASKTPEQSDDNLVWNLGDVPPLQSITFTLQLEILPAIHTFTELDMGATAWGTWKGELISTPPVSITLVPTNFADFLVRTIDANYSDKYLSSLIQERTDLATPEGMFEYVRSLKYESYRGSLRGTRGTIWSEAGNSLDQASLLIALLRRHGIPAAYRHGTLSDSLAQELILSMFPTPNSVIGSMPQETEISNPTQDPQLLAEAKDHWWVEAYLPNIGWTHLDPSFPNAQIGQSFVSFPNPGRLAEVPPELRHKVTLSLKIEEYHPLNYSSETSGLTYSYPLTHTFNTVELVGEPVSLGHIVNDTSQGGAIFYSIQRTYIPYFSLGNFKSVIEGDAFQDLSSNFPFGNFLITGEWLIFEVHDIDGNSKIYEREIIDKLGFEKRQAGGVVDAGAVALDPLVTEEDFFSVFFSPSYVPLEASQIVQLIDTTATIRDATEILEEMQLDRPATAQEEDILSDIKSKVSKAFLTTGYETGYLFYSSMDQVNQRFNRELLTQSYPDSPRIVIVSQQYVSGTLSVSLDLQSISERVVVAPEQSASAANMVRFHHGMAGTYLEAKVIEDLTGVQPLSVIPILNEALAANIPMASITANNLEKLEELSLSVEAKARITQATEQDKTVYVPSQMVTINDVSTIGWLELSSNGNVIGVMEDGLHQSFAGYVLVLHRQGLGRNEVSWFTAGLTISNYIWLKNMIWVSISNFGGMLLDNTCQGQESNISCGEQWDTFVGVASPVLENFHWFLTLVDHLPIKLSYLRSLTNLVYSIVKIIGIDKDNLIANKSLLDLDILFATVNVIVDLVGLADDLGVALRVLPHFSNEIIAIQAGLLTSFGYGLFTVAAPALYRILEDDPPLTSLYVDPIPDEQFQIPQTTRPISVVKAVNGTISIDAATNFVSLENLLKTKWKQEASHYLDFDNIYIVSGTFTDELGQAVAGSLDVTTIKEPGLLHFRVSSLVSKNLDSIGSQSYYASALSGLGAGNNWISYTLSLTSTAPYTLTIEDAIVTVNNTDTYTGSFTIVTSEPTTIQGSGHTAAPNFADSVSIQAQDSQLTLGPATGSILVGGQPLDASNGLALAGYTGPITITEATTMTDQVELNGNADFFTLHLSPNSSITDPNTAVTFQTVIDANFDDTYTTTVEAPVGWDVQLSATGVVTAAPPLGATPGDYAILVTAQSSQYPDLFVSAIHTVSTTDFEGMQMAVAEDPLITVPVGPLAPNSIPGDTNTGQMQLTGAAYTIDITNTSTVSHTFDINVSGLPAGWLILSGAEGDTATSVTLPAGDVGQIGLYISPTLPLPAVGSEFPFNVTATAVANPMLSQSNTAVFTMPAVPFNYITAAPPLTTAAPGTTATLSISLSNVGNAPGSFPVAAAPPDTGWIVSNLHSPLSLLEGETANQTIQLTIPPDADVGRLYTLRLDSPAPGTAYTQTTYAAVQVVTTQALPIYQTAAKAIPLFPSGHSLTAALQRLALDVDDLTQSCQAGTCDLVLRNRVAASTQQVAVAAAPELPGAAAIATLQQLHTDIAGHSDTAVLLTDLEALAAAITELCQAMAALQHRLTATFVPGVNAVLDDGSSAAYTLRVDNTGSLPTTAVITLTTPNGTTASWNSHSALLQPGETITIPTTITPTGQGIYILKADVSAAETPLVQRQARASLNVVDAFVRVLNVTADPPSWIPAAAAPPSA